MAAGDYRFRVKVQRRTEGKDGTGSPLETWVDDPDLTNRAAAIKPMTGRKFETIIGANSSLTTEIRMRWEPNLDEVKVYDRLVNVQTSEVYQIASPPQNVNSANKEIIFMCEEKERY